MTTSVTKTRAFGRATWTFVDQGLSSLTNAVVSIVVARSVSPAEFGAFAIAMLVFAFLIGVSRAVVTDPLVIRFSDASRGRHRHASADATAAAVILATTASLLLAMVALAVGVGGSIGSALLALAVVLPGLLWQDAWRFAFFAIGRPSSAAMNDLVWAVAQAVSMGWLFATGQATVVPLILCWGGSALVAGLVGVFQLNTWPALRSGLSWFRRNRELSWRLGADYVVNQGMATSANVLVAPVSSLEVVGGLTAARTLLGPLQMLFSGATSFVLPTMARRANHGGLGRVAAATSAGLVLVSASFIALVLLLPGTLGTWLLRDNWEGAFQALPGTGWGLLMVASVVGPALGLKARAQAGKLLRVSLIQAPLLLVLGVAGAWLAGIPGAAWGFAIAQTVGCVLTWTRFLSTERAHRP
ncbi:MAG: hypothetical protein ACOYBU_10180 [Dermatophilaceae bacterium]